MYVSFEVFYSLEFFFCGCIWCQIVSINPLDSLVALLQNLENYTTHHTLSLSQSSLSRALSLSLFFFLIVRDNKQNHRTSLDSALYSLFTPHVQATQREDRDFKFKRPLQRKEILSKSIGSCEMKRKRVHQISSTGMPGPLSMRIQYVPRWSCAWINLIITEHVNC